MAEIERLTTVFDARFDKLEEKLNRAVRATYGATAKMEKRFDQANDNIARKFGNNIGGQLRTSLEGVASRAGPATAALEGFGAAGLAAGVALGGLVIAANRAIEAMSFGDQLQASADKLQITAEALQELQFAADETDVPIESLQAGLEKLNGTIGAFKTGIGAKKVQPVFEALGITKDQLANIQTSEELLNTLADTLGQVQDTAIQVQLARRLGIEDLLPLLRQGSRGLQEMRDRAKALGLTLSNETVQGLADADRQMELATQQIQASLRVAFAGLATDIAKVVSALANFLVALRNSQEGWAVFARTVGRGIGGLPNAIVDAVPGGRNLRLANEAAQRRVTARQRVADIRDALSKPLERPQAPAGFVPTFSGAGGKGGSSKAAKEQRFTPVDVQSLSDFDAETAAILARLEKLREIVAAQGEAVELFNDNGLIPTGEAMAELGENLKAAASEARTFSDILAENMVQGFEDVSDAIAQAIVYGEDLGDTLLNIFRQISSQIISQSIQSAIGPILGSFGLPGFASGTPSAPGGLSWVGERGPELVRLPKGAEVFSSLRSRHMAGNSSSTFAPTLHINVSGPMSPAEARRTGSQIGAETMRHLAMARKRGY